MNRMIEQNKVEISDQVEEIRVLRDEVMSKQQENHGIKLEYNRLSEQFEILREKNEKMNDEIIQG